MVDAIFATHTVVIGRFQRFRWLCFCLRIPWRVLHYEARPASQKAHGEHQHGGHLQFGVGSRLERENSHLGRNGFRSRCFAKDGLG